MKFFIKLGPVVQDHITRLLCSNTINYFFKEFFEKGIPYEDYTPLYKNIEYREAIGPHCFASDELTVTYSGERKPRTLTGFGSVEFQGAGTGHWFNFYRDYSFEMGFPYDSGPVVEYGHCTKIELPK